MSCLCLHTEEEPSKRPEATGQGRRAQPLGGGALGCAMMGVSPRSRADALTHSVGSGGDEVVRVEP